MPNPWHQPPRIVPNYGKAKKSVALRSNITQVLLHDNVSQQQILDWELNSLASENQRITRIMDLQRKSFIVRQSIKQQQLRALGIRHISFLPDDVVHDAVGYLQQGKSEKKAGDKGKSGKESDNARKSGRVSNNRGKSGKVVDKTVTQGNGHQDTTKSNQPMATRSLTFANASDKSDSGTKLPQLNVVDRSKTELAENLKTFSTYEFHKQGVQETDNSENKTPDGETTKLEALKPKTGSATSLRSSSGSAKPRNKKKKSLRPPPSSDPRFVNLEKTLVRTCWPSGGYTQLSPCGSRILRDYGQPLFDYDTLHNTIHHYNSLPTPRRQPKTEEDEEEEEEGEDLNPRTSDLVIEEADNEDSEEED